MVITCRASTEHPDSLKCRTTAQDALLQHISNRNTSSQPFMTPCTRKVMNRIHGNVTPPWAGCWGQYTYQHRDRRTARPTPQTKTPHSTQKSEPPREKGGPLICSVYKQSGGSSGFSQSGPAFSLQREYLSVVTGGGTSWGPLGGSWSGLPWLSYTSMGRKPKIRFLTSSPRRASWCLESRLMHHHSITPLPPVWGYSDD